MHMGIWYLHLSIFSLISLFFFLSNFCVIVSIICTVTTRHKGDNLCNLVACLHYLYVFYLIFL